MENNKYWDSYYVDNSKVAAPQVPSQFAAFILNEIKGIDTRIVDFGCGNGRDSLFFARHGYNVLGVDASGKAVKSCADQEVPNADFMTSSVDDPDLAKNVRDRIGNAQADTTVYARFFIHAIDEPTQQKFLKSCRELIGNQGRAVFEFRTDRDASQTKITPTHYRRFVRPLDFIAAATAEGFKVAYFVEGFGFAKYQDDDAHVVRFILEPHS